ncbi:MAG: uracil-DNA glycosylase [Candidatus Eiseniibacteriota bacterium]
MAHARALADRIVACRLCPRLVDHCRTVARVKRRAYRDENYWGRPVPSFGDPNARLLVVGLAPGAHGANRTGRVFTGDESGRWLWRELHAAGFASLPESRGPDDGLALRGACVSCAVRCAPPGNRPTTAERDACLPWLVEELERLRDLRVVIALGRFAFDSVRLAWSRANRAGWAGKLEFAHAREFHTEDGCCTLITSYHPSRQNTQTGRLTRAMFRRPFARARRLLEASP